MSDVTTQEKRGCLPVLVVDLDGTLLRGDLLWESIMMYLLPAPWKIFQVIGWLIQGGRALMKARLAERVIPNGPFLPWNLELVGFCQNQAETGRTIIVATASNEHAARLVTRHLAFVSDVMGSSVSLNLKGEAKASRLAERFGGDGFDYVGDSSADIPVWKASRKAWFIGAKPVRLALERQLGRELLDAGSGGKGTLFPFVEALRPHQWLKNALVFVPLLAAHRWADLACWRQTIPVFLALCCLASASYLLNDFADMEADRRHPRKRLRPFADGKLGLPSGLACFLFVFLAGAGLAALAGPAGLAAALLYFVLSALYSLALKTIPVLDTVFLSGLYTYRIVLGGLAGSVMVSPWLLAFSSTFFLGLAFLKRYVELDGFQGDEASLLPGRGYMKKDLIFVLVSGLSSGFLSVVVLALYLDSSASSALYRLPHWLWGIGLILLFWTMRVWFLAIRKKMNDDPVWFAAKDPVTLALAAACLAVIAAAGPIR